MSDVPDEFESMCERAQHSYVDKDGILQVPDEGQWPINCPACEGEGSRWFDGDTLADDLTVPYPAKVVERGIVGRHFLLYCVACDGKGTVIA